jgi:hypothetical protein
VLDIGDDTKLNEAMTFKASDIWELIIWSQKQVYT